MSTFLFYKPNSNPNRYSRSERFSARHTVLTSLGNSLDSRRSPSLKGSTLPESVHPNGDNELRLNIHQAVTAGSLNFRADSIMSSDMSDACQEPIEYDLDSLRSLFSEPDTGSQSDFSEADGIASSRSNSTCSVKCVSPAGSRADARTFEENTQTNQIDCPSPDTNHYDQHHGSDGALCANSEASEVICESISYHDDIRQSSSPQPRDTSLESSLSFCGPTQTPSQCNILEHGECSGVIGIQDGPRASGHISNHGEMPLGEGDPQLQVDSSHLYSVTNVQRCTSLVPDSLECLGSAPAPPLSEELDLSPDTCTGAASPIKLSSPQLPNSLPGLAEEPFSNPHHSNVHYTETTDCVATSGLDRVPMDCVIGLDEFESCPPVSSPRMVDVDIQDPPQRPSAVPKDLDVLLAAVPSDGLEPDAEFQPRQELSVNRDGRSDIPVLATGLQSNDPRAAPTTPNSVSLPSFPEGYLEVSHVEIRNRLPLEKTRSSIRTLENTTNQPTSSCCHTRDTSRAWRLDGSTLSIDVQQANYPIGVGKSSFHVAEGTVIQIVTIVHGPVEAFLSRKPAPRTKGNKKRKSTRAPAAAAPLSSEQRQYLLELRDQGYTWNEIVAKFPGRKKGTLQAIYYTEVKDLRNPPSRRQRCTRRSTSATRSSQGRCRTQGNTIHTDVSLECRTENELRYSRYSLRPRRVR